MQASRAAFFPHLHLHCGKKAALQQPFCGGKSCCIKVSVDADHLLQWVFCLCVYLGGFVQGSCTITSSTMWWEWTRRSSLHVKLLLLRTLTAIRSSISIIQGGSSTFAPTSDIVLPAWSWKWQWIRPDEQAAAPVLSLLCLVGLEENQSSALTLGSSLLSSLLMLS